MKDKEKIIEILRTKGIKITPQRRFIIESILNDKTHPSAEAVYIKVKKMLPELSLATVYQTLELLEREGMLLKLPLPDGKTHYDPSIHPHLHFYCEKCEKIEDIETGDERVIKEFLNTKSKDFEIKNFTILIYGICKTCKQKEI